MNEIRWVEGSFWELDDCRTLDGDSECASKKLVQVYTEIDFHRTL